MPSSAPNPQVKDIKWFIIIMALVLFFIAGGQFLLGADFLYQVGGRRRGCARMPGDEWRNSGGMGAHRRLLACVRAGRVGGHHMQPHAEASMSD